MIVNSFQIDESLRLTPVAPEKIVETAQRADVTSWLDLVDFTPDELEEWLDKLGVEDLERQLCLEGRNRAGFYPLKRVIFFVIPVLADAGTTGEVDYVALLCKDAKALADQILADQRAEIRERRRNILKPDSEPLWAAFGAR